MVTAEPAAARDVTALVVTGEQPAAVRARGAVGLYVPGQGLYVSREEAIVRLGELPSARCGAFRRCPFEVFVSVPPLGAQPNRRRYDVTILGEGFADGVLESDNTRIRGLVSIADVGKTVRALDQGREPPIRAVPSDDPLGELERLDRRLDDAREAHRPATVALALVLVAFALSALATRSPLVARAALLYPLVAISLALLGSAVDEVGSMVTTSLMLVAAPVALGVAASVGLGLAVPVFLGVFGLTLSLSPETNSLMAIGPHPWSGGRFYGVTNLVETLLLGSALAAGAALRGWRLVALALLALVVVGASATGADGGGILVLATGFTVLWLLLDRGRVTATAAVVVLAVAAAVIALDALAGGGSHVVDAVSSGPGELLDAFERRARTSVTVATSTGWQLLALLAGVATLAWFAALPPRFAAVDALVAALSVSLLVNDSPTKVAGFGAIMCAAVRAWSVSRAAADGIRAAS